MGSTTTKLSHRGSELFTVLKFQQYVKETLLSDLADEPLYQEILSSMLQSSAEGQCTIG